MGCLALIDSGEIDKHLAWELAVIDFDSMQSRSQLR